MKLYVICIICKDNDSTFYQYLLDMVKKKEKRKEKENDHKTLTFQRILAMQINPLYFCSDTLTFSSKALTGFYCCHKGHCSNTELYVQFPKPWHAARDRGAEVL